jgi:hypothetical protein
MDEWNQTYHDLGQSLVISRPFIGLRYIDLSKYEGGDSGDEAMASAGRWRRNPLFEAMGQRVWEMIR